MTELIEYGNLDSDLVLIQPVDDHSLGMIGNEIGLIRQMTGKDFRFIAVKVSNWNNDLSPWSAPAVFGKEDFGRGASDTLNVILNSCSDRSLSYYIGGYSLAALFSLWASYQTDVFAGVAAASPSMWFPGFTGYMNENRIKCGRVYLSLGDREEKTRNPVMATVGVKIREAYGIISGQGSECSLEWNEGNHFKDADIRTAKAFAWIMGR